MKAYLTKLLKNINKISSKAPNLIAKEQQFTISNQNSVEVVITRGEGNYVWDVDGKRYLDCISGDCALNLGHKYARLKDIMVDQLDVITLTSRAVYNDRLGEACRYLINHFGYDRAILTNGEDEAVETAIKFARRWAYMKKNVPKDQASIIFAKGHEWGSTIAASAIINNDKSNHYGPFGELGFKLIPYNDLDSLEKELSANPHIAAFIVEPIQNKAGIILPDDNYLINVRNLCTKYNVLMILDEITTGLGRTGKMLCQEHNDIKADMVCIGKTLSSGFMPISAVLGSHSVFECITPGTHGSTYGGNPLASVLVKYTLKNIVEEGVIKNSDIMGKRLLNNLKDSVGDSKFIKAIRGKGLLIGIEFNRELILNYDDLTNKLLDEGMLCMKVENDVLRITPPLTLNGLEADYINDTLSYVIGKFK